MPKNKGLNIGFWNLFVIVHTGYRRLALVIWSFIKVIPKFIKILFRIFDADVIDVHQFLFQNLLGFIDVAQGDVGIDKLAGFHLLVDDVFHQIINCHLVDNFQTA